MPNVAVLIVLVAATSIAAPALARYVGEPVQFTPDIAEWIRGLHSPSSRASCCDISDGEFTQQDIRLGADGRTHWWATIKGDWFEIPDDAVVTGPNFLGRPIIWSVSYINIDGLPVTLIRCFLPGALG